MTRDVQLSIAQVVFAVALTIAVLLAGTIIVYSRAKSHDEALLAANALMRQSAEIVRWRVAALIDPIDSLARQSPYWRDVELLPDANGHPTRSLMLLAMHERPQISAIELGFDGGDFYFLGANDQFTGEDPSALEAPETARFLEETIRRGDRDGAWVIRRLLAADGNVLRTERSSDSDSDPRTRPWFEGALATDAVTRTDVYRFARSGVLGLTVSRRHETGVVGVDITLHELAAFLNSAPQARAGVLAIFHPGGAVLAHSTPGHAKAAPSLSGAAIRQVQENESAAGDLRHAAVVEAVRQRRRIEPEFRAGVLEVGGEEWLANISEIALGAAAEELLLVV